MDKNISAEMAVFHLPRAAGEMVVAEALDFPGALSQGFDLAGARVMIASARSPKNANCHTILRSIWKQKTGLSGSSGFDAKSQFLLS